MQVCICSRQITMPVPQYEYKYNYLQKSRWKHKFQLACNSVNIISRVAESKKVPYLRGLNHPPYMVTYPILLESLPSISSYQIRPVILIKTRPVFCESDPPYLVIQSAPLKLGPYRTIQMCLLLLLPTVILIKKSKKRN